MTNFRHTISEEGETIDSLLRQKWQAGKKTVHEMRMDKSVTDVNGEPLDWSEPLAKGTELILAINSANSSYKPEEKELRILFEDEHILAVYKDALIATHPERTDETGTLMNYVMAYIQKQGGTYAEHIHRLDKGTNGLLLIAKHPIAKATFDRLIENNELERYYIAEVDGRVKRPRGTLNYPIGRDRHHPSRRRVSPSGQQAITHYRILERHDLSTAVEARLETGRTHQIRVHFAHIGNPVVGDTVYGGSKTSDGLFRLTASKLAFTHPLTGDNISISI